MGKSTNDGRGSRVSVELFGWNELQTAMKEYVEESDKGVESAIKITALAIAGDAIKSIQRGAKTGKKYKRGSKTHTASAPGEAPATDSGNLVARIGVEISPGVAYVGTDEEYGFYLEFGTMNLAERPWLRPAREKNRALFNKRIKAALS